MTWKRDQHQVINIVVFVLFQIMIHKDETGYIYDQGWQTNTIQNHFKSSNEMNLNLMSLLLQPLYKQLFNMNVGLAQELL